MTTMTLLRLLSLLIASSQPTYLCRAFVMITTPSSAISKSCRLHASTETEQGVSIVPIRSEADIQVAADFMVDAFWLNSPQGLVLDDVVSDATKKSLIQQQADDLQEKYGERMGKRLMDATLLQAVDSTTNQILGLVGMEVSLLDKGIGDTLSITKSDEMLKNAVASLGPKQRRQYKSASVIDIATELLPPPLEAVVVLSNLVVSPTARRRGIAQILCRQVEHIASAEWGYTMLHLRVERDNAVARTLYESKLGFTEKYELLGASGVRVKDGGFTVIDADTLVLCKDLSNVS